MWSILGCAAGQDMVLVSVPKHGKLFYAHLSQPGIVSKIDIPFRFFCPKQGQGVKPAASPLHPNIAQKTLSSPPPPLGAGGHRSSATLQNLDYGTPSAMKYLWPKLCNTVIPEQNAVTLPSQANNNLNSLSTALSALSPCN